MCVAYLLPEGLLVPEHGNLHQLHVAVVHKLLDLHHPAVLLAWITSSFNHASNVQKPSPNDKQFTQHTLDHRTKDRTDLGSWEAGTTGIKRYACPLPWIG